jgi:hypothetical protein
LYIGPSATEGCWPVTTAGAPFFNLSSAGPGSSFSAGSIPRAAARRACSLSAASSRHDTANRLRSRGSSEAKAAAIGLK